MTRQLVTRYPAVRFLLIALVLLLAFVVARAGVSSPAGAGADTVAVHGHWSVDVLAPDGSLVAHHEFDNALSSNGRLTLPQVLAGEWTVEVWAIEAQGDPTHPCNGASGSPAPCFIRQGDFADADNNFSGLTVASQGTVGAASLVLAGDMVVANDTSLDFVATRTSKCLGGDCTAENLFVTFSEKSLASLIPVTSGQTVHIEVEISFD